MTSSSASVDPDRRLMARTAAGMYGGAAFVGIVEGLIPGGPGFSFALGVAALAFVPALLMFGPRLPRPALASLGPLGAVMIAVGLATSPGPGDGAVLYVWPVLWTTYFFGRVGALLALGSVGLAHVAVLIALPAPSSFPDRWFDVMTSVTVVAAVVLVLVRQNEQLVARLAAEARVDPLTGLLNRRGFAERAAMDLARARRDGTSLAVASVDIDFFKRINDEWGHGTGDQVLVHLASLMGRLAREIDAVARVGGEEFVVLLPGATTVEARAYTQRLRTALAAEVHPGLPEVRVSAGVAAEVAPADLKLLLHRADTALYAAKSSGRNRTVDLGEIADPALLG